MRDLWAHGFIPLMRWLAEHPLHPIRQAPLALALYVELMFRARYQQGLERSASGRTGVACQVGEAVFGRTELARQMAASERAIRRSIKQLRSWQLIDVQSDQHGSRATLIGYKEFWTAAAAERPANGPANDRRMTGERPASGPASGPLTDHGDHSRSRDHGDHSRAGAQGSLALSAAETEEDPKPRADADPKPDRSPTKKPKPTTDTTALVKYFATAFEAHQGVSYVGKPPRDNAVAKALVDKLGLTEAQARVDRWFRQEWPHAFTFTAFNSNIDALTEAACRPRRNGSAGQAPPAQPWAFSSGKVDL